MRNRSSTMDDSAMFRAEYASQTNLMKWCSRNTKNIDSVVFRNQMSATANVNISWTSSSQSWPRNKHCVNCKSPSPKNQPLSGCKMTLPSAVGGGPLPMMRSKVSGLAACQSRPWDSAKPCWKNVLTKAPTREAPWIRRAFSCKSVPPNNTFRLPNLACPSGGGAAFSRDTFAACNASALCLRRSSASVAGPLLRESREAILRVASLAATSASGSGNSKVLSITLSWTFRQALLKAGDSQSWKTWASGMSGTSRACPPGSSNK
mmetsp:Transcript_1620/g.4559  ORF Transcript_1620/g.4559 Transcript_1620/m.4559 type:complete len:263 (-) Transcript_1620:2780-3568(-)